MNTSDKRLRPTGVLFFVCMLWSQWVPAENRISIHEVATRPGVTVRLLLIEPERPAATLLLFPGGNGRVSFEPDGTTGYRGFPVRRPELFAQQGFMTAVINVASDTPATHFLRDGAAHQEDIRHVMAFLRKRANIPLWLVGHSAGSTSVASAAITLRDASPAGIVLISSENGKADSRSGYLDVLKMEEIAVPALVVHHEQDECPYTLFRNILPLMARLQRSTRSDLLSFKGGGPVSGDSCGSLHYHGFPGLELPVATRIGEWIKASLAR